MKLRCTHNSIRIRLRKSELETLARTNSISESVGFDKISKLQFSVSIDENIEQLNARLSGHNIEILIPQDRATQWIHSNEVGIEFYQKIDLESRLHLLIEKDFPCLDREDENKMDTFWELAPNQIDACK